MQRFSFEVISFLFPHKEAQIASSFQPSSFMLVGLNKVGKISLEELIVQTSDGCGRGLLSGSCGPPALDRAHGHLWFKLKNRKLKSIVIKNVEIKKNEFSF